MLDMADIKPGDVMIDLGCGDGRMMVAASRRGARGYGVDIDPVRIKQANENARKAGVTGKVDFKVADLFTQDLSKADVMAMYLRPDINLRLRPDVLDAMKPATPSRARTGRPPGRDLSPIGLILRSIAKQCVSKDGAALSFEMRPAAAPQDEGGKLQHERIFP
jgi:SAM-dependent methyltransferase